MQRFCWDIFADFVEQKTSRGLKKDLFQNLFGDSLSVYLHTFYV